MRRTPIGSLVAVLVAVAVVGWIVLRALEGRGVYLPVVPWLVDIAILGLAAAIFWAGWAVRSYQKGKRPTLDGIRAARTLVLAKAAALTGALLGGWYLAQVLVVLGDLGIESRRDHAVAAGIAVLCSVVLTVVGLVVEKFCEIPPSDPDDPAGRDRAGSDEGESPAPA
ncbi:DUF3180 domain-containing protein [Promicromonospora citrea]|uniref:DUF3180 domain-containing protein n=1 Tax=Promicromonospora citrea TaxID=43677 RepID=A0A8H9L2E8_9MICO|nr:DUF3180 domain-containing protein [Promicromonospora citrea]NNH54759.1 DUF3180 domain-containing protein [Promicromonospora citrea]GGM19400.1 hypothetical protein GCM10010102_13650 [Promicromonospora citrea]